MVKRMYRENMGGKGLVSHEETSEEVGRWTDGVNDGKVIKCQEENVTS